MESLERDHGEVRLMRVVTVVVNTLVIITSAITTLLYPIYLDRSLPRPLDHIPGMNLEFRDDMVQNLESRCRRNIANLT